MRRLDFTTGTYIVNPLFFPGSDIGKLAVHGTINDLAMAGTEPLYLSTGFILEEGFPVSELRPIITSMATVAKAAGVSIVRLFANGDELTLEVQCWPCYVERKKAKKGGFRFRFCET